VPDAGASPRFGPAELTSPQKRILECSDLATMKPPPNERKPIVICLQAGERQTHSLHEMLRA
jgi:hypothetical protein